MVRKDIRMVNRIALIVFLITSMMQDGLDHDQVDWLGHKDDHYGQNVDQYGKQAGAELCQAQGKL